MTFGPIVRRELLTAARSKSTYWSRASAGLMILVVMCLYAATCDYIGRDRTSLEGVRRFGLLTFSQIVSALGVLTFAHIIAQISPMIAKEREKKSIDALLASQLSGTQIVLGAMGAGLVRHISNLAAVFPILALMVPCWGVDPWLILLSYAGLASFTFAMAGVTILESVHAPDSRRAALKSGRFFFLWVALPFMCVMLLPRLWPAAGGWANAAPPTSTATAPTTDRIDRSIRDS